MKDLIREKWSDVSAKLEDLLNDQLKEISDLPTRHNRQDQFELQVQFHGLESLSVRLPENHVEKVVTVYKRLHLYFQFGLLLENNDQKFSPVALFEEGHLRVAPAGLHEISLSLPQTKHLEVLSLPSQVLTRKLKLNWDATGKCKAYLIRPTSDFAFILLSPVPDLWMHEQMELLVRELRKIFSP
jgi:hypothetical protein